MAEKRTIPIVLGGTYSKKVADYVVRGVMFAVLERTNGVKYGVVDVVGFPPETLASDGTGVGDWQFDGGWAAVGPQPSLAQPYDDSRLDGMVAELQANAETDRLRIAALAKEVQAAQATAREALAVKAAVEELGKGLRALESQPKPKGR